MAEGSPAVRLSGIAWLRAIASAFAERLFATRQPRETVVGADTQGAPPQIVHPAVRAPVTASGAPVRAGRGLWSGPYVKRAGIPGPPDEHSRQHPQPPRAHASQWHPHRIPGACRGRRLCLPRLHRVFDDDGDGRCRQPAGSHAKAASMDEPFRYVATLRQPRRTCRQPSSGCRMSSHRSSIRP